MAISDEEFSRRFSELSQAVANAMASIEHTANDETAYRRASKVVEMLQEATASAASLRVSIVRRIQETGRLSLAQLGERIGVSKARAADMVNAAKRRGAK